MFRRACHVLVTLASVGGGVLDRSVSAAPITMDFEDLQAADASIRNVGAVYTAGDFALNAILPPEPGCCDDNPRLLSFGTLSPSFDGSTSLYIGIAQFGVQLTRIDGGAFDMLSMDLAEVPNFDGLTGDPVDLGSFQLTFVGVKQDASTVTATATIDPFPAIATFTFADFTDLRSVTWFQGPGGVADPGHQFDNIRVDAVPEPTSLWLLGTGILGASLRSRLHRRHPQPARLSS